MEPSSPAAPAPEFDAYARDYDEALGKGLALSGEGKDYFAEGRMRWLARRLAGLGDRPRSALDFGCGTGSATPHFFRHLALERLVGADPSEESLRLAREAWREFPVAFHAAPPLDETGLDLAYCNGVFHHIPPAGRPAALALVHASLRPGGCFAFWENNPWNPVTRLAMSQVPFDRDAELVWPGEARRLLRAAGFQPLATDYLFFFPRFAAFLRPLEPALRWLPLGGQYLVLCRKPETAARAA